MFSTLLMILAAFVGTIFVPALARNFVDEVPNDYNTIPKLELLPQNEYLIGEETPVYFLKNITGKLDVQHFTVNDIFKSREREEFTNAETSRIKLLPDEQRYTSDQSSMSRQYTFNPEILVIIDYDLYSRFNEKWESIIPYVMTFWNAVDLKFRSLQTPPYRLNIAGIIVAETPEALPYINDFILSSRAGLLAARDSLDASTSWLYENQDKFSLSNYDIAVTMTPKFLCKQDENLRHENCGERTMGVTYQARACHDNDADKKTYKTAIIHNEGNYDRVLAAAHTIGLLMNLKCRSLRHNNPDEYIFAAVPDIITSSDWSDEQLESFENFYADIYKSYCLATTPERGEKLPTYLPGMIMNADEQCRKLGYMKAYKIDASLCTQLTCSYSDSENDRYYLEYEAPDGTECGIRKMCLHSECVSLAE